MSGPLSVADYERLAEERLEPGPWAYLAGGSGDEWTLRENRDAWNRFQLLPLMLRGVAQRSLETTVLGTPVWGSIRSWARSFPEGSARLG